MKSENLTKFEESRISSIFNVLKANFELTEKDVIEKELIGNNSEMILHASGILYDEIQNNKVTYFKLDEDANRDYIVNEISQLFPIMLHDLHPDDYVGNYANTIDDALTYASMTLYFHIAQKKIDGLRIEVNL